MAVFPPMQAYRLGKFWVMSRTPAGGFATLPSSEPVFASFPVPCSKKIPYPARTDVLPSLNGSQATPIRGAGLNRSPFMQLLGTGVPSLYLSTPQRTIPLVKKGLRLFRSNGSGCPFRSRFECMGSTESCEASVESNCDGTQL